MTHKRIHQKTKITLNESVIGESIETKVERIIQNKEPISDAAPIIYTDRREGVQPAYNIRSDRFDIAIEAMDKVSKTKLAQRDDYLKKLDEENKTDANEPEKAS